MARDYLQLLRISFKPISTSLISCALKVLTNMRAKRLRIGLQTVSNALESRATPTILNMITNWTKLQMLAEMERKGSLNPLISYISVEY